MSASPHSSNKTATTNHTIHKHKRIKTLVAYATLSFTATVSEHSGDALILGSFKAHSTTTTGWPELMNAHDGDGEAWRALEHKMDLVQLRWTLFDNKPYNKDCQY